MSNLTVSNNFIYYQEQGIKGHEGSINYNCVNCLIQYNDISNWHRIGIETQEQGSTSGGVTGTNITFQYNSAHDPYTPGNGTFAISSNNAYPGTPGNSNPSLNTATSNDIGNVLIDNVAAASGSPDAWVGFGIEFWSMDTSSIGNYNLIQGEWVNSFMLGPDGAATVNNNIIQNSYGACGGSGGCSAATPNPCGWFNTERTPANTPTSTGNSCSTSNGTIQTSATPTISPASGSYSSGQAITFTNTGTNRDSNTGIWYTTDGSTPVPGSGTAKYIASGGTYTLTANTTIKAVGMWGAANQPASYPTGPVSGAYGYQPSSVVTNTYTVGTPTLIGCYQTSSGSVSSIAVGQYCSRSRSALTPPGLPRWCARRARMPMEIRSQPGAPSAEALSRLERWARISCSGSGQGAGCVKGVSAGTASATATVYRGRFLHVVSIDGHRTTDSERRHHGGPERRVNGECGQPRDMVRQPCVHHADRKHAAVWQRNRCVRNGG